MVIAGTVFGAGFLILAKKIRDKVELSHYMYLSFLVNLPMVLVAAVLLEDVSFTRPIDPHVGSLGWLTSRQIGLQLFISVCGTIFGTAGYVASLKYFAPTVVSVAMLTEPIFAALLGWAARVNAFPSGFTLAGMAAVSVGTLVISLHAGQPRVREMDIDGHRRGGRGGRGRRAGGGGVGGEGDYHWSRLRYEEARRDGTGRRTS